jgi:hypothetical protein
LAHAQVLDLEEEHDGKLNLTVRLKKRALQGAYDQALKRKKVSAVLQCTPEAFTSHVHCQPRPWQTCRMQPVRSEVLGQLTLGWSASPSQTCVCDWGLWSD